MNDAAARAEGITKVYGWADTRVTALDQMSVSFGSRTVQRGDGAVRFGQIDPDALHGRARRSDERHRLYRRHGPIHPA